MGTWRGTRSEGVDEVAFTTTVSSSASSVDAAVKFLLYSMGQTHLRKAWLYLARRGILARLDEDDGDEEGEDGEWRGRNRLTMSPVRTLIRLELFSKSACMSMPSILRATAGLPVCTRSPSANVGKWRHEFSRRRNENIGLAYSSVPSLSPTAGGSLSDPAKWMRTSVRMNGVRWRHIVRACANSIFRLLFQFSAAS